MRIDLDNQQYRQFVEFATAADKDDFAKLDNGSVVKKTEWDYYGNAGRWKASRDINDTVRTLFKSTILSMFGVTSEEQLPETLRSVMKLHDYGEGRPLSARRIRAVDREIKALAAVNFSGKMANSVAETVLKGSGIPKELDPAQELKRRMTSIAKAMVQTSTAKKIGVFLRTDSNDNKIDHFDFDKKNTAFEKDLCRDVDVRVNGGPVLSETGYQATRDEIVKFITDGHVSTFAAADDKTKLVAHVLMANANQAIASCVMSGVGCSFDPQGSSSRLTSMGGRQTFNVNFVKDGNGNIVIKCDIKFMTPMFDYTDENGRRKTCKSDTSAYSKYHMDVTITQESLDKFANAHWENLDYDPVEQAERNNQLPHPYEEAADLLPDDCRLDVDVDISYEMHADKFFEMDERVVEPGKRSDHNAAIATNLANFEFDKLPEDILEALDDMKGVINARCGEGTVNTREETLQLVSTGKIRIALDNLSLGLERGLDGKDLSKVIGDIMKATWTMEQAKLLERMKAIAADKGIAAAKLSRSSAYNVMRCVAGLKDELEGCQTPVEFAAVLDKYAPEIEKRLRLSAKAQQCKANAPEMLVQEYVKATGIAAETVRPLIFMNKFKADEVDKLVEKIEKGEVNAESEADIEKAFADIAKKYVADRQKLAEEADKLEGLPDWARRHLRLAALTAQTVSEFRLSEFAPLANQLDLAPLKAAVDAQPFDMKNVALQLTNLCKGMMVAGMAHMGEAFDGIGADALNTLAGIVFTCAFAKDPALVSALAAKADEIEAAVFEIKKPGDIGEGVAQNDFINLKQLNGRILQSVRELHEAKNAPVEEKAEPVAVGHNEPEDPKQDEFDIPDRRLRRKRV